MDKHIRYREGYKYQLAVNYVDNISIFPEVGIHTRYIQLSTTGELCIIDGYAWDGPSGPTIDTDTFMRGALVHDALYQLMRMELLSRDIWRGPVDELLRSMCIEDGMWVGRAWWVYQAVSCFGGDATRAANVKMMLRAP